MHMVGHQAVANQGDSMQIAALSQQVKVNVSMSIGLQDVLATAGSLLDVVGLSRNDNTRKPS